MSLDFSTETAGAVHYLETDAEVAEALAALQDLPVIAIDTEFMREKTYYAKLCLLQIATEEEVLLIDALRVRDYRLLAELLTNQRVTKVFHAGGQDLEILYQVCGVVASPYFDTQDAAELAGYNTQVGYGALVAGELDVKLRKADSFTDWARRPLTKAQLSYAAEDVIYLLRLYPLLRAKLEETGRLSWLQPTFRAKTDLAALNPDPREAYRKVKHAGQLRGVHLAVARELGAWREEQARRSDRPRRWILGDESLVEIARRLPKTEAELKQIRGVNRRSASQLSSLLSAVSAGANLAPEQWPEPPAGQRSKRDVSAVVDLMSALVRLRARENNIATTLLARRGQLEAFALSPDEESPLLQGWRREIVGTELLQLLQGNLVLSLEGDRLKVVSNRSGEDR
ncbi:MAG: ribonuclease D [Actinomycetia bacterium]|nr:ribonuclease D [Actinomycetes bacterium]